MSVNDAHAVPPIAGDVRPADIITLLNALTGLGAIYLAATGDVHVAALLVLLGILLDGADGAVARLGGGGGPLGGHLDALSDVVTFAVAPATLLLSTFSLTWTAGLIAAWFLAAVLLRLARFESLRERKDPGYFVGLSSPGGALLVAGAVLLGGPSMTLWVIGGVAGILMVSRQRYPKLRGWLGTVAVTLILGVLADAIWTIPYAVEAMMVFLVVYVLAGPLYIQSRFPEAS